VRVEEQPAIGPGSRPGAGDAASDQQRHVEQERTGAR
jgi:hypothetical protein